MLGPHTPNEKIYKVRCGALRNLILIVQFSKREKHPWRSVNFSNVAGSQI